MKGLGYSPMSQNYGITSLDEARAYLEHSVLRQRLIEITKVWLQYGKKSLFHKPLTAFEILGTIDAIKVRSCMTLFDVVEPNSIFAEVLDTFYQGKRDNRTLQMLNL